ncbi:g3894 [Coccomyxa elongata]
MSSIGEKIKEKLHIGTSSDDTPSSTAAEHTTKATSAQDTQRRASAATGVYGGSGAAASPTTGTGTGSTAPPPTPTTGMGTGTGTYTSTTKTPANSPMGDIRPGTAGTTTGAPSTDQASSKTSKTGTGGTMVCETTCVEKSAGAQTTGGAAQTATGSRGGAVCDTKYYTTVEDRPVEKEIIERVVEHHPVEKKFVVETRPAGEHELTHERRDESLGTREEIKRVAPKSSPCEGGPELVVQQK